jgi:hypothetical protein
MNFWTNRALFGSAAAATLALLAGCSSSTNGAAGNGLGADGGPLNGTGAMGASGGGGTSNGGAGSGTGGLLGKLGTTQCSDGIDNDGDGLIDGFDPECTGPLDNDEGSFATGIPGDNRDPKWQDCFFDGNSGAGDDGCRYSTDCLTGKLEQTDPNCTVTQQCLDFCKPLIANGCDCFGCCTVRTPTGTSVNIEIGSGCSLAKIGDATACPVCTKSAQCQNTCGTCELCPGKTVADLPASCAPPPPPTDAGTVVGPPPPAYTCDSGAQVCSATIPCPSSYYCSQGCCIAIIR